MNGILYKRGIFLTELGIQLVGNNAARRAVKTSIFLALFLQRQTQAQLLGRNVVVVCCVHC